MCKAISPAQTVIHFFAILNGSEGFLKGFAKVFKVICYITLVIWYILRSIINSMMIYFSLGDTLQLELCPVRLSGHATALLFFFFSNAICQFMYLFPCDELQ